MAARPSYPLGLELLLEELGEDEDAKYLLPVT
jgi:hypothetical protein